MSDLFGRLQFWLQGHGDPPPYRPWALVWLGNQISSARYWWWRFRGGTHEMDDEMLDEMLEWAEAAMPLYHEVFLLKNTTTNYTSLKLSAGTENTTVSEPDK